MGAGESKKKTKSGVQKKFSAAVTLSLVLCCPYETLTAHYFFNEKALLFPAILMSRHSFLRTPQWRQRWVSYPQKVYYCCSCSRAFTDLLGLQTVHARVRADVQTSSGQQPFHSFFLVGLLLLVCGYFRFSCSSAVTHTAVLLPCRISNPW